MNNPSEIDSFIRLAADLVRNIFKRAKYQNVLLQLIIRRRFECVLQLTNPTILEKYSRCKANWMVSCVASPPFLEYLQY